MAFNAGVYTLPSNSWNPAVSNTTIDPAAWNATGSDISTALSTTLLKDGTQTATALIPFAANISVGIAGSTQGTVAFKGSTSGTFTVAGPATASGTLTFPAGTTNLSATGGTGLALLQTASGAAITVGQISATALSGIVPVANGGTGAANFTTAGLPTNQNIIQNGDMFFDQRNEGAALTLLTGTVQFPADRWKLNFTVSTSSAGNPTSQQQTPSSGLTSNFAKSILFTMNVTPASSTPAALNLSYVHQVEGPDVADLGWGTASASAVTVSGWLKTSITGSFGIALRNGAANRSYPHLAVISSANTWTFFSFVVPGDTSGTWLTGIGTTGMNVSVSLSNGSNFQGTADTWNAANNTTTSGQTQLISNASATMEVTGLKLERGSLATPSWSVPTPDNFNKMKRFYWKTFAPGTAPAQNVASVVGALTVKNPIALGDPSLWVAFNPPMFASPTVVTYNPSAANANWRDITAGSDATVSVDPASTKGTTGVLIATSGTVTTLGDVLGIHATFDSGA